MTANRRCTGEPVSWLRLERYHLGDVRGAERVRIAEHLSACPACAACLDRIEQDEAVALPPLPAILPRSARWRGRAAAAVGALAAAAVLTLVLRGTGRHADGGRATPPSSRAKGDAMAFSLVRDDGERIDGDGVYRDGDRFKAIVTCPPGFGGAFDVVVYDAAGASFPLEPAADLACANDVPVPGAFRLTGNADETVCLVWNAGGMVDREKLAAARPTLGDQGSAMCKTLSAARP